MGARTQFLTEPLAAFISCQPLFFVASAPLSADGHVNLIPKGLACFRALSPTPVANLAPWNGCSHPGFAGSRL